MHHTRVPVALFLLAGRLMAQDALSGSDDPFSTGAFDSAVTTGTSIDSANKLTYLGGMTFIAEANGTRLTGSGATGSDSKFYGKAFVKASRADVGALYLSGNFNYFLFAAAGDGPLNRYYSLQSPDPGAISAGLSEFHFSFDVKKLVFIRVGSQLISWGATYFWSPADFINLQKTQAPVLSPIDSRNGKPGIRLHIPLQSANIFLFTDFSAITKNKTINALSEGIAQAWHLDATVAGVNLGTMGYIARNKPVQIGFSATGNLASTDIYSELAFKGNDTGSSGRGQSFSIGASKAMGPEKNWTVRGEFYFNSTGYGDSAFSSIIYGSFVPLYSGKYYIYSEISATKLLSSVFGASLYYYMNLADNSFSSTLQLNFDFPGVLPFSIYGRCFGGKRDREFTSLYSDRALQVGIRIMGDF